MDIPEPCLGNGKIITFPLLGTRFLITQQFDYNNGIAVFSAWAVPSGCKQDEVQSLVNSWSGGEEKTLCVMLLFLC
jgi:hypothetical protein